MGLIKDDKTKEALSVIRSCKNPALDFSFFKVGEAGLFLAVDFVVIFGSLLKYCSCIVCIISEMNNYIA